MKSFRFDVSCRQCGSPDFEHVNGVTRNNSEAVAVCRCVVCGCEWSLLLLLRPLHDTGNAAERKARSRREQRAKASIEARDAQRLVVLEAEEATIRQQVNA